MFSKYEYVYAIYTEKSFTKAAKRLYISQPSLSAAIKNIEKKVGAPLFERSGHYIQPTEIGREYIAAAEKIMHIESDFENRIHDIYSLESGKLTVGGTNYLCSYVLPEIINRFASSYPKIEVTLAEANSGNLLEMINNEEIDILLDSYDENMYIHEGSPLLNERILLCVPAEWKINEQFKESQIRPESIYGREVNLDDITPVPIKALPEKFLNIIFHNRIFFCCVSKFIK